jgi:hypothetical protein
MTCPCVDILGGECWYAGIDDEDGDDELLISEEVDDDELLLEELEDEMLLEDELQLTALEDEELWDLALCNKSSQYVVKYNRDTILASELL